jgi:phosphate transport system permease protein
MRLPSGIGDRLLYGLCGLAGLACVAILGEVLYQVIHGASPAISKFGIGFIGHAAWNPVKNIFGASAAIYGTVMSSLMALLIATPLGIAIGLYLSLMAPRSVRRIVGPLVEMLAAIPSVIVGLWGLIVLAPFLERHIESPLHSVLGWTGLFGSPQTTGLSIFTAGIVLSIMILPIIASLSRDLFLTVPKELEDGASALGATRWEMIRGVVLPTTFSGVAAATVLGLGRALGEAIAVTQVVGDGANIQGSVFQTGQTLASRIANDYNDITSNLQKSSLFYLAVILLIIAVLANSLANFISTRFAVRTS